MDIKETAAFIFIIICACYDYKTKEIPVWIITVFGIAAIIFTVFFQNKEEAVSVLYAFIPGAFLLLLSFCTREGIGYGDGFAVLVIGLLVGFQTCVSAVCSAFILSSAGSIILLVLRRVNRKTRIPFMPFLAAGLGAVVIGNF